MPVKLQLIDLFDHSATDGDYLVCISGRTEDSRPFSGYIRGYKPWLRVVYKTDINDPVTPGDIENELNMTLSTHWLIHKENSDGEPFTKAENKNISIKYEPEKKSLHGFTPSGFVKEFVFKISCMSIEVRRAIHTILNKTTKSVAIKRDVKVNTKKLEISDATLENFLDWAHEFKIRPCGWVEILKDDEMLVNTLDVKMTLDEVVPIEVEGTAPFVIASMDIECWSTRDRFPDPSIEECKITMISTVFQRYGEDKPYRKHIAVLGGCAPPDDAPCGFDDVDLVCVGNEVGVINEWFDAMSAENPDIMTFYNGLTFDSMYIYERAKRFGYENMPLSRFKDVESVFKTQALESGALGANLFKYFTIPGCAIIDMLCVIKREHKLPSYKLDDVAEHFMNENKNPVKYWEIFELCMGSDQDRGTVALYCVQDCMLPLRLMLKLNVLSNEIQMANVTCVPIRYLQTRGQQIKCYSQIAEFANENGFTVPKFPNLIHQNGTYTGAIVLDPVVGFHTGWSVAQDFKSLYPSLMMSNNLSYETYVQYETWDLIKDECELIEVDEWKGAPGTVFKTFKYKDYIIKEFKLFDDPVYYRFVQNTDGLLPRILTILMASRKAAKKQKSQATDPFMKAVYDGKQLAIKVSCNSVYGFTASQMIPNVDIAACTTGIGRSCILETQHLMENNFSCKVIYGDTDSNYVTYYPPDNWDGSTKEYAFHIAPIAAEFVTKELDKHFTKKKIMELEFEKALEPMILYSKKRYLGMGYESIDGPGKVCMMGLSAVRRDNCYLLKDICDDVINMLISPDFDLEKANELIRGYLNQLVNNEIPLDKLVTSKSLSKPKKCEQMKPATRVANGLVQCNGTQMWVIKNESKICVCTKCKDEFYPDEVFDLTCLQKQAHSFLARKIGERNPALQPKPGDRVPYVYVKNPEAKIQAEKSEDPGFVEENNLEIDATYYIKTQLSNPLHDLLSIFQDSHKVIFEEYLLPEKLALQAAKKAIRDQAKQERDALKAEQKRIDKAAKDKARLEAKAAKEEAKRLEKEEKARLKELEKQEKLKNKAAGKKKATPATNTQASTSTSAPKYIVAMPLSLKSDVEK